MNRLPMLLFCAMFTAGVFAAPPAKPLPKDSVYQLPLVLVDQGGKRWDWRSKRGQPQLVSMFYTSCPYVCPLIVDSGKAIEKSLTPAERDGLGILLISMDPANDDAAALLSVATSRGLDPARWSLGSPKAEEVRSVAGVLGVRYRALADGGFNHTTALLLLDRDGRVIARTEQVGSRVDPEFLAQVRGVLDGA